MTDEQALKDEREARSKAQGCPVYASGKEEPDAVYKATVSGMRSAVLGDRWIAARTELKSRGLTPLE